MVLSVGRQHVVIYITGLNDHKINFQKLAVGSWRIYGVNPIVFQTGWADNNSFSEKLDRLLSLIYQSKDGGNKVSLAAASAGASLAVAAYARNKNINAVVFICGKLNRPEAVGEKYYAENPSFRDAMKQLNSNVAKLNDRQRSRIMSITPLFDETVAKKDTYIPGAKNIVFPALFHVPTIALIISLFSFLPIGFVKNKAKVG